MNNWKSVAEQWLAFEGMDATLKQMLENMSEEALMEAFIQPLSFGTAGMRGILGPGINRMNIYTVRQATKGLADFIRESGTQAMQRGVVISYDSRHMSAEFAKEAAAVLVHNGIQTYLFDGLRPTPTLSFAVRHLQAFAGIMITASHNPAEYNGYKLYGEDGGQMPPADADKVIAYVRKVTNPLEVAFLTDQALIENPLYTMIGEKVDQAYLEHMETVQINPAMNQKYGHDINILYTPLHGTGLDLGMKALNQSGFTNVQIVASQAEADGAFPTVSSPNPESQSAFDEALKVARTSHPEIILATDPDADRLGAMIRDDQGQYQLLTGNQIASLMLDYILRAYQERGDMPLNAVAIKSIVSTDLATAIAHHYGAQMLEVLTGFKFIAEKIKEFEATHEKTFLFGFEESYGYLVKSFARDKDAIQALVVLAELTTYHQTKGRTLYQALQDIFDQFGYFMEKTISVTFPGVKGQETMMGIMQKIRQQAPQEIANREVLTLSDYSKNTMTDAQGHITELELPISDALKFKLSDGSWVALRPSGTEPKLKLYIGVQAPSQEQAKETLEALEAAVTAWTR